MTTDETTNPRRGLPGFGFRMRKLEQRVRRLEAALCLSEANQTDRRDDAEYPTKETVRGQRPNR